MPEKDFSLFYEVTHPPLYIARTNDEDEYIYVSRDVDVQFGIVRWIIDYFYGEYPQHSDCVALTFDICGEPGFGDLDMLLRDTIADMMHGGPDERDDIEFVLYEEG